MQRPERSRTADEKTNLAEFLDYLRATLVWKVERLDSAQAATRSVPPSTLTLAGIVKHMALVEEFWFRKMFLGLEYSEPWASAPFDDDPDWDFTSAADDGIDDTVALYEEACARSRDILAAASLDDLSARERDGEPFSMRWIMLHMIEETARHAGHADLLREAIDGETGD